MYKLDVKDIVGTIIGLLEDYNNCVLFYSFYFYSFKLGEPNNLSLEERMFCTLVQNISKTDDVEMAKMYQHLTRILHSFGDGCGDNHRKLAWDQLELKLNE